MRDWTNAVIYDYAIRALWLFLFVMVASINCAVAETLCDGLKIALREADDNFVRLRGAFDFDLTQYRATITFGAATDCWTENGDGSSSLFCTQRFEEEGVAKAAFAADMNAIQTCFGRGVTLRRSNLPYSQRFKHEETTDAIEIRLGSLTHSKTGAHPTPYITITVLYIDPSAP